MQRNHAAARRFDGSMSKPRATSLLGFFAFLGLMISPGAGQTGALPLPQGVKAHRDIAYVEGGHERQKLDLYLPEKREGPLPLILWVHGGGWQSGSKDQCLPLRQGFVERGYAVASIGYRLSGDAVFPAQIEDCKAAVRWLRVHAKEYHLDPQRFGAWGSSAGGHLAALLGTSGDIKAFEAGAHLDQSSRVQAVCDYYGPTDFAVFVTTSGYEHHARVDSPESKLIGGAVLDNKEEAARANSIQYVSGDDPPFLIVHGDADATVPINQSQLLFEALKNKGASVHFHTIKGAGHGGPGFAGDEIDAIVTKFFDGVLLGRGSRETEPVASKTHSDAPATRAAPQRPTRPTGTPAAQRPRIPWALVQRRDDPNNDGKVTLEEFRGPPPLFQRLDQNGDGVLTPGDFDDDRSTAPRQMPPPPSVPSEKPAAQSPVKPRDVHAEPKITSFKLANEHWTCEADGESLSGILIKPEGRGPFPAILINHGMGSNAEQFGRMKAREFAKWGMACIATDLTHSRAGAETDRSLFGASSENIWRARACLAILRSLPDVDAQRIGVYGNSMGAFLTIGLAAVVPDQIAAAAITAGGVITQAGFPSPTGEAAAKIRTPFLILHGNPDNTVPTANSERLKEVLDKNQVPNERHVFDGIGHNLHAEKADEVYRLMRAWFAKHRILTSF